MRTKNILMAAMAVSVIISGISVKTWADELKGNKTNLHVQTYGKDNTKLAAGIMAPDFKTVDSNGKKISLADYKGKKNVLLVFYPGDNTPGCTKQLCALRDDYKGLEKLDVKVFGVNPADAESHNKFIKNQKYPFQLLVDKDKKIAETYDAVGMLGFINRTVVLINKEGKIVLYERGMPEMKPAIVAKLL
jgi:peroxiredoxin Q/BCP